MGLPIGDICYHLPDRRINFGQQTIELANSGASPRSLVGMVSIKNYPSDTMPGMFDELYRLPFGMDDSEPVSFAFVERREALSRMNLVARRMRSAEDEAVSLRDELLMAKDDVAAGRAAFGEHHTTIAIRADTIAGVDTGVAEVTALLADLGIVGVCEDIALKPAFWAQFPGNFQYITRRGLVSTENFVGLASLHNYPVGKEEGNHWGDAVTLFETTAAGLYFFNFHQADLGNFTVIGPSGSGKTVVLNFLLAQARRFHPRIIFSTRTAAPSFSSARLAAAMTACIRAKPLSSTRSLLENTGANRQFLIDWVVQLAGGATTEELDHVREVIDANFDQPPARRRLRHLVELFRGYARPRSDDFYSRLRPWWGNGERAWLFYNKSDLTDLDAETVGFDMTAILDDPIARTPALMYFFHRVEERLDGEPAIIIVDEG